MIWYQLSNDADIDPVQEFTRINNGKIPLTDTELIKALLLQKKNFETGDNVLEQTKISLQWEQMENTLQRDDFWCFISNKGVDEEDRMGELLKLVFLKEHDIDAFGDAYEYLMTMYASNAGKSGGEFFTPADVSELLTRLGTVGKKEINKVYDPACGSGSLLLKAEKVLGRDAVRNGFFAA